mmetsp:Transcript_23709/g.33141  ORF Transcript_23709/g.33141 Transcript_23709/m.33141 type:complete len:258 (+) Transcript_23709:117-890(+)|eukprot:CAMPEP_0184487524 /NCGR_PEP_ID=MMETSP0113_2-20130426/10168_1 /TAXON_ID=91329 /ORGANISM="Norrisiella sphaerica, Strain BC52" /LENGTH=257 /DNA_ID=CAMNT_0026869867 /DNA_START=101 /DNA_END=874 /DNA_ORIENTATION=-
MSTIVRSLISLVFFAASVQSCWKEENGVIKIEAENTNWEVAKGDGWAKYTKFGETVLGFKSGSNSKKVVSVDSSKPICYNVQFTSTGKFFFEIRNINSAGVDHNDVWVEIVGLTWKGQSRKKPGKKRILKSGYIKLFRNHKPGKLRWDSWSVDFDAHRLYVEVRRPGGYNLCVKGRSTKFFIDKLMFYKFNVSETDARSRGETKCGDSTTSGGSSGGGSKKNKKNNLNNEKIKRNNKKNGEKKNENKNKNKNKKNKK